MPPPTGVVSGPLMDTTYSLTVSRASSDSQVSGLLSCIDFHPGNTALAVLRFLNSRIHELDHHRTDVDTDSVTLYIRNDRYVGYAQGVIGVDRYLFAHHLECLFSGIP